MFVVQSFLLQAKLPALYRVHPGPNEEKVTRLYDFLRGIGIGLARKTNPTPQRLPNHFRSTKKSRRSSVITNHGDTLTHASRLPTSKCWTFWPWL